MSNITDQIPSTQCDICQLQVYNDDNRAKRHVLCQDVFARLNTKHANRIRRRLAKEGKRLGDDDRDKAYIKALVEAKHSITDDMIEAAKQDERDAIERAWQEEKEENALRDDPIPEDVLAYDYFGTLPDKGADPVEGAGAPKGKQNTLTNNDVSRLLDED